MKQYIFILSMFFILLPGCTNTTTKYLMTVTENKKAVIFGSCHVRPEFIPCNAMWRNEQNKNIVTFEFKNQAQVIEPGIYSFMGFISNQTMGLTYSITNLHNIASFSVKGGEVLYIGNLEFDRRKAISIPLAIAIFDDKDDFSQYLSKYQPELLPRLQTRLIQLSPDVIAAKSAR